jgi:hypothetical protein
MFRKIALVAAVALGLAVAPQMCACNADAHPFVRVGYRPVRLCKSVTSNAGCRTGGRPGRSSSGGPFVLGAEGGPLAFVVLLAVVYVERCLSWCYWRFFWKVDKSKLHIAADFALPVDYQLDHLIHCVLLFA